MKKFAILFFALLVLGCLYGSFPFRLSVPKSTLDTLMTIWNDSDSMFFVVNEHHDTIDWWGYSQGVEVSKKQFEEIVRIADTLLILGYKKSNNKD